MSGFVDSFSPILSHLKPYRLEVALVILALFGALISLIVLLTGQNQSFGETTISPPMRSTVVVAIAGAVNKPGVYEVTDSARLQDLLALAGGLADQADKEYFSRNFNLAKQIVDQEKIYVPSQEEINNQPSNNDSATTAIVNINTANLGLLDSLPGIGQVTAQKIIDNRPYQSIEELLTKKVVKKNIYEQIKELISL